MVRGGRPSPPTGAGGGLGTRVVPTGGRVLFSVTTVALLVSGVPRSVQPTASRPDAVALTPPLDPTVPRSHPKRTCPGSGRGRASGATRATTTTTSGGLGGGAVDPSVGPGLERAIGPISVVLSQVADSETEPPRGPPAPGGTRVGARGLWLEPTVSGTCRRPTPPRRGTVTWGGRVSVSRTAERTQTPPSPDG